MDWLSPAHAIQYILKTFTIDALVQALVDQVGKDRIKKAVERSR
jgi:hypothetical protein